VLGALGKREGDPADLDEREKPIVRRQAMKVIWQSALLGIIAAVLLSVF